MKTISLWQPWAQWIAFGWKTIETRTHGRFANLKGERIGIHAAQRWDVNAFHLSAEAGRKLDGLEMMETYAARRRRGGVLCTALVSGVGWAPAGQNEELDRKAMVNTGGKFLMFLADVMVCEKPVLSRGSQGVFHVPDGCFSINHLTSKEKA